MTGPRFSGVLSAVSSMTFCRGGSSSRDGCARSCLRSVSATAAISGLMFSFCSLCLLTDLLALCLRHGSHFWSYVFFLLALLVDRLACALSPPRQPFLVLCFLFARSAC